jgi:hypothetical protein
MFRSDNSQSLQPISAEARGLLRALLRLKGIRYPDPVSGELVREGLAAMVGPRLSITHAGRQYASRLAVPAGRFRRASTLPPRRRRGAGEASGARP